MKTNEDIQKMISIRQEITRLQKELQVLQTSHKQEIRDFEFQTENGPVLLSQLFGDADELLIIHNMGRKCAYCTLWADALNGLYEHIQARVPIVLSSPDSPEVQRKFAASRNWKFKMISTTGNSFTRDLGFEKDTGVLTPGVSALQKIAGEIFVSGQDQFYPGDSYCAVYPIFDLLSGGSRDWKPDFTYSQTSATKK